VIDGRGYRKLQDCRHITAAQNDCRLAAPAVRAATVYLKGGALAVVHTSVNSEQMRGDLSEAEPL
jgi:hypothetical protein